MNHRILDGQQPRSEWSRCSAATHVNELYASAGNFHARSKGSHGPKDWLFPGENSQGRVVYGLEDLSVSTVILHWVNCFALWVLRCYAFIWFIQSVFLSCSDFGALGLLVLFYGLCFFAFSFIVNGNRFVVSFIWWSIGVLCLSCFGAVSLRSKLTLRYSIRLCIINTILWFSGQVSALLSLKSWFSILGMRLPRDR